MSTLNSARVADLLTRYCNEPEQFWSESSSRQARKIAQRLRRAGDLLDGGRRGAPQAFAGLAVRRHPQRRRTVYLSNIGSSGSHWLEAMLVDGAGFIGAGEVYLPPRFSDEVNALSAPEAACFIDALHLLHAVVDPRRDRLDSVINSQHAPRPQVFLDADIKALRVLLIRDPVEICLSRTYRKDEYRQDVAPDSDDDAYLEANVKKVKAFFAKARPEFFDLLIRYEDLKADPVPGLVAICALTNMPFDTVALGRTAQEQSAEQVVLRSGQAQTNLYGGSDIEVPPQVRRRVERMLSQERVELGYTQRA